MINLNTPLGEYKKTGIITDIKIEVVTIPSGKKPKANLIVEIKDNNKIIKINSALVTQFNGTLKQQGFWLSMDDGGKITPLSTIGRFMRSLQVNTLDKLKGKTINLHLGEKDLLVAIIE